MAKKIEFPGKKLHNDNTMYRVTCGKCECRFTYQRVDVIYDQREGDKVSCPWCEWWTEHNKENAI